MVSLHYIRRTYREIYTIDVGSMIESFCGTIGNTVNKQTFYMCEKCITLLLRNNIHYRHNRRRLYVSFLAQSTPRNLFRCYDNYDNSFHDIFLRRTNKGGYEYRCACCRTMQRRNIHLPCLIIPTINCFAGSFYFTYFRLRNYMWCF